MDLAYSDRIAISWMSHNVIWHWNYHVTSNWLKTNIVISWMSQYDLIMLVVDVTWNTNNLLMDNICCRDFFLDILSLIGTSLSM